MSREIKYIPLNEIRENKDALRKVNRKRADYVEMVDSVRSKGIMNSITVRQMEDNATGERYYCIIDGLHRFNAAKDAGLDSIPAQILDMNDIEVLEAQILANVHKVETRPVEYSKQLVKILQSNPTMTIASLSNKLSKSSSWVTQRLGLVNLVDDIAKLANEGQLNVTNATMLAKLDEEDQKDFLDRAMTQSPAEFIPTVNARIKQVKEAKRKGKDTTRAEFEPVPHLRKLSEIKGLLESPNDIARLVKDISDPESAAKRIVEWILTLDPEGVAAQKADYEDLKKKREEEKKKRQEEREQKRAQEAAEKLSHIPV